MDKIISLIKKAFMLLTKTVYIGIFVVISVLLLKMLYFPGKGDAAKSEPKTLLMIKEYARNEEMIKHIVNHDEPVYRNHFHITDEYVLNLESEPPICLTCHGVYPHNMKKKIISLLNLHVGFMACEICHIPKKQDDTPSYFRWADLQTGKISMKVKGEYGQYKAKIVPLKVVDGKTERIDRIMSSKFSAVYEKLKDQWYSQEERHAEVKRIHDEHYLKKPVSCKDCHKKSGYLNYAELGFSAKRTTQLISSEVISMIEHYDTFYMPRMLMMK